jgi:hypothetical protein
MPNNRLDGMMRKVESLLARADHPNTPEAEAETARRMAETIMAKYKIEEEDLLARGDLKQDDLHVLFKEVHAYPMGTKYADVYRSLMSYAVHHAGCFGVWTGYDWATGNRIMTIVGYEADIRYAEALYMGARLLFADRMEPKVDPSLSDKENVYRLRSAGMERRKVAELMGWVKGGAKVTRLYKQACEERGEDAALTGRGTSVNDFKDAYTDAFKNEFWSRLWRARSAIDAEVGGGLVLHGREDRIKEAAYQRWPELRPVPVERGIGEEPKSKATRLHKETAADRKRAQRRYTAGGRAGIVAGRKAASEVDVKGSTPIKRLNEGK